MDPPARERAAFPGQPLSRISAATQYADPVRIHAIFGGIGAFAVKFRWLVIVAWVVAAVAVPKFLPSLASVTQGNNSAFLPANAPSQHAADLAAPFGISTADTPVPVVAAVSQGTLTAGRPGVAQHPAAPAEHGADRGERA